MLRRRKLRVPPLVVALDGAGTNTVEQVGALADLAALALDPAPVALLDAKLGGRVGMDLEARARRELAQPRLCLLYTSDAADE